MDESRLIPERNGCPDAVGTGDRQNRRSLWEHSNDRRGHRSAGAESQSEALSVCDHHLRAGALTTRGGGRSRRFQESMRPKYSAKTKPSRSAQNTGCHSPVTGPRSWQCCPFWNDRDDGAGIASTCPATKPDPPVSRTTPAVAVGDGVGVGFVVAWLAGIRSR